MEPQTPPPPHNKPAIEYSYSTVDTSRPFSSVKEAVAMFGEKFLAGEIYSSPKPFTTHIHSPWKFSPSPMKTKDGNEQTLQDTLKRLESELEGTKMELKELKERESETEVALASLNAELHKNMSKIAQAEAAAAAKAVAARTNSLKEEEKKRDLIVRMEDSPTLAEILSIGEEDGLFGGRNEERKKMMMMKKKKKPIIPLFGDLFSWKKGSSASLHSSLFSSTHVYLN